MLVDVDYKTGFLKPALKNLFLVGKRIKPSIGMILPFVLFHSAVFRVFSIETVFIALGFASIYLFADLFNDFYDLHEDVRNRRLDKLLISTNLKKKHIILLSYFFCVVGLLILFYFSFLIGLLGMFLAFAGWAYSHPWIRLKKYEVLGYIACATPFFILPFVLSDYYGLGVSLVLVLFAVFCYTQYVYILCQKDSTDLKDDTNLFLKRKNKAASIITAAFSLSASFSLFLVILFTGLVFLLPVWLINFAIKLENLRRIYLQKIQRGKRFRLTTYEFISHYAFFIVAFLD